MQLLLTDDVADQSWLLIFDNVVDANLRQFWPSSSHGSIIITSQLTNLGYQTSFEVSLEAFNEDEGSELILNLIDLGRPNYPPERVEAAKALSNQLGGLPLLLSHVAGFLQSSKCSLGDILKDLQEPSSFKQIWGFDSTNSTNFQYGEPMRKVWNLALKALTGEAFTTLQIMAMLSPDGIAEDLLIGEWEDGALDFLASTKKFEYVQLHGDRFNS